MINLNDYYSGGYILLRANKPDWPQLKTDLLPDKLVSLSHLCPKVNVNWGWVTGDKDVALSFGIPEAKLNEFAAWCAKEFESDMDMYSVFHSTDAARRFARRFLTNTTDLYLIGTGLNKEIEESNWRYESEAPTFGISKNIEQHFPLEVGGISLGFEVVSFSYDNFSHSWLCNYLHQDMHQLFDIRPNEYGLIATYDEANKVYDWITEDKMKGSRAEPEPYDPWLLVSYPLNM
jgi:hypothetical protein